MTKVKGNGLAVSQMPLNRASSSRKNSVWLAKQRNKKNTVFIPVWRGNYFFDDDKLVELSLATIPVIIQNAGFEAF